MSPTGFEPTVPASEQPQTDALDRAATAICPALGNSPQRSTGNARPGRKMGLRFKRGEPPTANTVVPARCFRYRGRPPRKIAKMRLSVLPLVSVRMDYREI